MGQISQIAYQDVTKKSPKSPNMYARKMSKFNLNLFKDPINDPSPTTDCKIPTSHDSSVYYPWFAACQFLYRVKIIVYRNVVSMSNSRLRPPGLTS